MSLFSIIDFLAVFAGAMGGAAEAARDERNEYDIVGVVGLGIVSALGGGITRDVLLNHGPPLALVDIRYLIFALAGSLLALGLRAPVSRSRRNILLVIDAAGLGLYAVAGSTRAWEAGLSILPSMLLGAITAAGGGAWRDVLSGRTPAVFQRGSPYVLVALIASAVYFGGRYTGALSPYPTVAGAGTGFVLRLLALRFGWTTKAVRRLNSGGKRDAEDLGKDRQPGTASRD